MMVASGYAASTAACALAASSPVSTVSVMPLAVCGPAGTASAVVAAVSVLPVVAVEPSSVAATAAAVVAEAALAVWSEAKLMPPATADARRIPPRQGCGGVMCSAFWDGFLRTGVGEHEPRS
jgi:hypothetical protein